MFILISWPNQFERISCDLFHLRLLIVYLPCFVLAFLVFVCFERGTEAALTALSAALSKEPLEPPDRTLVYLLR